MGKEIINLKRAEYKCYCIVDADGLYIRKSFGKRSKQAIFGSKSGLTQSYLNSKCMSLTEFKRKKRSGEIEVKEITLRY